MGRYAPILKAAECGSMTRAAQAMGLLLVIPLFCLVKFFEDSPGLAALPAPLSHGLALALGGAVLLFALSYGVSVLGFRRRRQH